MKIQNTINVLSAVILILLASFSPGPGFPKMVLQNEEVIYEYVSPQNDTHPFWCHGSSIMARDKDKVYMSGIETLKNYKPSNNIRWTLWMRDSKGWALQQSDETGRTREPCPIGLFSDGRIVMSANPTLDTAIEKRSTINRPEILEFSSRNLKGQYKTINPEWKGSPVFTEHTYRTFAIDGKNNEFILFQNARDLSHYEYTFRSNDGKWYPGHLNWKKYENDPIVPYGETWMRIGYPSVVVHNRSVHFFGCAAFNKWSRIQDLEDAKKVGLDDIVGRGGGQIAGGRFRRLYYTWTPDATKEGFSELLEIANTHENGENIRVTDMYVDAAGTAHLLWHQNPINKGLRDQFWPDIKRVYAMNYAQVKNGRIVMERSLVQSGDTDKPTIIEGLKDYSISWGRFHVAPGNRIFMIYYVSGTSDNGQPHAENRILEVYNDGSVSESHTIPLKNPMSFFMMATPRGGSMPSKTIDIIGQGAERNKVRYATINLKY